MTTDSPRKRVDEALRKSEERYRLLIENSHDIIYTLTLDGVFTFVSPAWAALLGHPVNQVVGKPFQTFVHPDDIGKCEVFLQRVLETRQPQSGVEYRVQHADGSWSWHVSNGVPIMDKAGRVVGFEGIASDITERKRSEDALVESKEKIHLLLDSTAEAIYGLDMSGNCTFCNNSCLDLLGYKHPDELLGKNMHWQIHAKHPDGTPFPVEECRIFQAFIKGEGTHVDDEVLWRSDGTSFPAEYWSYPQRHDGVVVGAVVTFLNITERKRSEEALRQLSDRLLLASRAGGVGIWDYDVVNNKLVWDDQMYRLYGITSDKFSGAYEAWQTGLHPEDKQRGDNEIQMALGGEKEFNTEFRVLWPDGTIRNIRALAIVQRDSSGKPFRMIGTNWDITDSKRAEKAVKEAAEIKSRFTSMVSHELRSPLGAIKEGINLVVDGSVGDINDRQRHFLSMAKNNIDRLGRLINNVLDFQKIESHKMEFDIRQNDLNETVMEVVKTMSILAENKGLTVITNLGDDLPKIMFDNDRINQVLTNIVSNAIKLTDKGSISINTKKEDNAVHVIIQDSGPGIREEDIQKLFQPFEQLDSARDKKKGGSGLGLAISKDIIIAHNGKIWAESEFGKGSTFHFILPIK